jgi:thiol:disulfide interchange protein
MIELKMGEKNSKRRIVIGVVIAVAAVLWIQYVDARKTPKNGDQIAVTKSQLETPRMMELYTPYCPSCREMAPLIRQLKAQCESKEVQVVQVDISRSDNEWFVEEYEVSAVPTFIFIDENGLETARLVGKQQASTLMTHLAAITDRKCLVHS